MSKISPYLVFLIFSAVSGSADEVRSLTAGIDKARAAGVRVDLIDVQISKPSVEIPAVPVPSQSPEASPSASDSPTQEASPLHALGSQLGDEESRLSQLFSLQKQSVDGWVTDPLDRVNRNYSTIIAAATTLCCGKNPEGVPKEAIQHILQQTGLGSLPGR
jgi:hypothetical protein